ncbi:MAG: GspH/FimT family protein [Rhodoferax sp.]|nr:GspH/FimT family protein [Rhodoferax sp.]MCF8208997.1 GspH/FimT family protein [Rhodoferax sp.]
MAVLSAARRRCDRGVTLVELLVVVGLIAVLASLAAPSFTDSIDKYRLKGAAETLQADLQLARMMALRNGQNVHLNVATGASWCYGLNVNAACDCTTASSCSLKQVNYQSSPGATLSANTFASGPVFDPVRGVVTPAGTLVMTSAVGKQVQVNVSLIGKVGICTPSGVTGVGYQTC